MKTAAWVFAAVLCVGIAAGVAVGHRMEAPLAKASSNEDHAQVLQSAFNRAASLGMRSVVHIVTSDGSADGAGENFGSGVIVGERGQIITNYHVIRLVKTLSVRFVDGQEFPATVVGQDPESDLALLQIDAGQKKLHPLPFADSNGVHVGDIVFAIGSPYGYTHTVTQGIVSAKHRRMELGHPYEDFIQTDAGINPGNSGGALVNLDGELVGLNAALGAEGSREGIGLAISSNLVKWVKDRLVRDGKVRRGYLGIGTLDLSMKSIQDGAVDRERRFHGVKDQKDLLEELGLAEAKGVLVRTVSPDSPAAQVLQVFDVVTEIGGKPVRDRHELFFSVAECSPQQKVKIRFVRDRKPMEADVVLAERPPVDPWGRPRR